MLLLFFSVRCLYVSLHFVAVVHKSEARGAWHPEASGSRELKRPAEDYLGSAPFHIFIAKQWICLTTELAKLSLSTMEGFIFL